MHYTSVTNGRRVDRRMLSVAIDTICHSRLRTIIAALHCNILVRKEDLVRNLDYVANVLEAAHQDETR